MDNREKIQKNEQKIKIINSVTGIMEEGYVVFAEPDNEIPGLVFLYIRSEDDSKNINFEPKLGYNIWTVIDANSPYIMHD